MKKQKVIFVYDAIYPYIKGGAERRFYELGKRLVNDKTEVHLYGMKLWPGPKVIKHDGLILHGVGKARPLYTKTGRRSIKQAFLFGLSAFKIIGVDFDTIDCCSFPYFSLFPCKIATMLKHKTLYVTWHEVWGKDYWLSYLGIIGYFGYTVERLASRLPDEIITISHSVKDKLQKELNISQPIHVVANGVDHENLQLIKPNKNKSSVIYVGRLVEFKHIDILVKSVERLKNQGIKILCNIVGDGPELSNLQTLVNQLQLKNEVKFIGFQEDSNDIYKLLKSSKILVLPSTREGFGMVVVEAHACGLPVITIDNPNNAAKYLVKHQVNGSIVPLRVDAIASAIKHWLSVDGTDYSMYARKYSWRLLAQKQARIYNQ